MELKISISEEDYKAVRETPGCQELTDRLYDAVYKGVVLEHYPKPGLLKAVDVSKTKLMPTLARPSKYWPSEPGQVVLISIENLYENRPRDIKLAESCEKDYSDYFILADGDHVVTTDKRPDNNGGLAVDRKLLERIQRNDFDGCVPVREFATDSYSFGGALCDVGKDGLEPHEGYYFTWVVKGDRSYDSRTVAGWGGTVSWNTKVILIHV